MGKQFSMCWKRRTKRKVTLLMLGLDNAGKTTAVNNFMEEPSSEVVPTVGFSTKTISHKKFDITIFDLGGGNKIRAIWKNYYALVHGVVFVVDSSNSERLTEGRDVIRDVIQDSRISGKPILLLVNKQDIEGALNEVELCSVLELEDLVNEYCCPTRVETSSAIGISKSSKDKGIDTGFKWLLEHIDKNFGTLNFKVNQEEEQQKQKEQIEREERMERVRKIREEREKLEANENNITDDGGEAESNPFRPITDIQDELKTKDVSERKASVGTRLTQLTKEHKSDSIGSLLSKSETDEGFSVTEGDSEATVVFKISPKSQIKFKKKVKKKRFLNKIDPLDQSMENGSISLSSVSTLPPLVGPNKSAWGLATFETSTSMQIVNDQNANGNQNQSNLPTVID